VQRRAFGKFAQDSHRYADAAVVPVIGGLNLFVIFPEVLRAVVDATVHQRAIGRKLRGVIVDFQHAVKIARAGDRVFPAIFLKQVVGRARANQNQDQADPNNRLAELKER
jgi:hypothetical protein